MKIILSKAERKFLSDCAKRGNAAMTKEEKSARGRKAAAARWRTKERGPDGAHRRGSKNTAVNWPQRAIDNTCP